eukprot:gb/GECH01014066.1/.p1 GENE.gb/GECH01014066.1/~~gb/GECH01014066.1/.p1  ORF type:complete len:674 (+),score=96.88 gb/GECH01014066.1/:1-2022(+)
MNQERRINVLLSHLHPSPAPPSPRVEHTGDITREECVSNSLTSIDVPYIRRLLDGNTAQTKDQIRQFLTSQPGFDYRLPLDTSRAQYQAHVLRWAQDITRHRLMSARDLRDRPAQFFAAFEALGFFDHSLCIKMQVQLGLWGATVLLLGTEKHHRRLLDDIDALRRPGVFGLTEQGHGTNVSGMQTTATYDPSTEEFIVDSPRMESMKYWPGNIAAHGIDATVFARLIVRGVDHGIHAFIVPFRNPKTMEPYPGVHIMDIGPKRGFNGVDNGALRFSQVRIPRDNMLDRYSSVTRDGEYRCAFSSPRRHFGATLGALSGGRIGIASLALSACKVGTTIAIRYAHTRKQFSPDPRSPEEQPIMEFVSHQRRLMPALASCYALDAALKCTVTRYEALGTSPEDAALIGEVHAMTAGMKSRVSWESVAALQTCRESCGGQGYRLVNRISMLHTDADMYTTGEGDNTVMMHKVTQEVLKQLRQQQQHSSASKGNHDSYTGLLRHFNSTTVDQDRIHRTQQRQGSTASSAFEILGDTEWLISVFRVHERCVLDELQRRIQDGSKLHTWNDNLPWIERYANAFVDRLVLESCIQTLKHISKSLEQEMLHDLYLLHSLRNLNRSITSIIGFGIVKQQIAFALDDKITSLCRKLTPYSQSLVEAFGIPERCLPNANLALEW